MKKFILTMLLGLITFSQAYGGGLILYEVGTPDVGLASAGWAARAEDAGTVFTNPAGMTRFKCREILVGAQPINLNIKFHPNSNTTVAGSHGNASNWLPAGGFFYVTPVNSRLSMGTAMLGYFGSALNYGHHWVGRYYLTRTECQGFSFLPGAAYKVSDCLSVGVCAHVMYAINRVHSQVNNAIDGLPDGRFRALGSHWAVGAVVGILYEPTECTRFGVTYVSEVKQKFNLKPVFLDVGPILAGDVDRLGISNSRIKVLCTIPNWVMASAYHKITPCLALVGNIGWQQWSRFARAELTLGSAVSRSITFNPKYLDTWHVALGAEYYFGCSSIATLGFAYDSSMITNKNRTPSLPVGSQWRFGAGYQFAYNECLRIFRT